MWKGPIGEKELLFEDYKKCLYTIQVDIGERIKLTVSTVLKIEFLILVFSLKQGRVVLKIYKSLLIIRLFFNLL